MRADRWYSIWLRGYVAIIFFCLPFAFLVGFGLSRAKGFDRGIIAFLKETGLEVGVPAVVAVSLTLGLLASIDALRHRGTIVEKISRSFIALALGMTPAAAFALWIASKYGFR